MPSGLTRSARCGSDPTDAKWAPAARDKAVAALRRFMVSALRFDTLEQMLRFRYALNRLTTPGRTCWFLEGLDEADPALRAQWVRLPARLAADHPGMRFVVSNRASVQRKDGVVRGQLSTWKLIPLNEWSPAS